MLTENKNFELVFTELISTNQKNIIMDSLYRPPNTSETEFLNLYNELLNKFKLQSKKEVILALNHNLDLLKCHIHTENFLEINLKNNILPCITRPIHITKTTATLV